MPIYLGRHLSPEPSVPAYSERFASVRNLVAIAILLDIISQYLIFREIHPGAALLLGPVLIAAPYSLARALANRVARGHGPATSSVS
jgi:hypothetical protein